MFVVSFRGFQNRRKGIVEEIQFKNCRALCPKIKKKGKNPEANQKRREVSKFQKKIVEDFFFK